MTIASSIQGQMAPDCLKNVLMLMAERRSERGVLQVESGGRFGEIWVHDGLFLCASFGRWRDTDAVDRMLQLVHGKFTFTVSDHQPSRTLMIPLTRIVRESLERIEVASHVAASVFEAPPRSPVAQTRRERFWSSLRMVVTQSPPSLRAAEGAFEPLTYILTVGLLSAILAGESFVLSRQIRTSMVARVETQLTLESQEQELRQVARRKLVYSFVDQGHMLRGYGLQGEALTQYRKALEMSPGDQLIRELVDTAEAEMATNAAAPPPGG